MDKIKFVKPLVGTLIFLSGLFQSGCATHKLLTASEPEIRTYKFFVPESFKIADDAMYAEGTVYLSKGIGKGHEVFFRYEIDQDSGFPLGKGIPVSDPEKNLDGEEIPWKFSEEYSPLPYRFNGPGNAHKFRPKPGGNMIVIADINSSAGPNAEELESAAVFALFVGPESNQGFALPCFREEYAHYKQGMLVLLPVTLAFDIVTFPFQVVWAIPRLGGGSIGKY